MARHAGWRVTVVERAPAFRDGGQNVDVRGVAKEVLDRMGLVEAVRARNTTETGTVLVDADGSVRAELPDGGGDGATAELEVLRGDLAHVLLDALPSDVTIRYGETIADVTDDGASVTVHTDAGTALVADLLVVAEGVRSSTRSLVFADDEVEARDLGVAMVFGTIPREPSDDDRWRWYNAVEGRQVHLRPDPHGTTRAILACTNDDDLAASRATGPWPGCASGTEVRGGRPSACSTGSTPPTTCTSTSSRRSGCRAGPAAGCGSSGTPRGA